MEGFQNTPWHWATFIFGLVFLVIHFIKYTATKTVEGFTCKKELKLHNNTGSIRT